MEEGRTVLSEQEYRKETAPFPHEVALARLKGEKLEVDETLSKNEQLIRLLLEKVKKLEWAELTVRTQMNARDNDVTEVKAENKELWARVRQLEGNEVKLTAFVERLQADNAKLREEIEPTRARLKELEEKVRCFRVFDRDLTEFGWEINKVQTAMENCVQFHKRVKRDLGGALQEKN